MLDIKGILDRRGVPNALVFNSGEPVKTAEDFEIRREEIKRILAEEEYGAVPPKPDHLSVEVESRMDSFSAGKAPLKRLKFICTFGEKKISFPVYSIIPKKSKPIPAFVVISFRRNVPDIYLPAEEITDRGFALFSFCYTDISSDDNNFSSELTKQLVPTRRKKSASGKIALWAWAAMRVMDYVETLACIDKENVAVIGHSRLGKAAMLAGGFDERFKYIISNDSGSGGAAISRGKIGESFDDMARTFPFWFCPKWLENTISARPHNFDQNFLAALSVPRHLMIGSATEDFWADPESEFLGCASTNSAYELYGKQGLVYGDEIPESKTVLDGGEALYHIRDGLHYFSREDWLVYMDYIDKVIGR